MQKVGESDSVKILAESTPFPASWAENSLEEFYKGVITYGAKDDFKGPVGYIGVWQKDGQKMRIAAYGNSSFIINAYAKFPRNFMLFFQLLVLVN